MPSRLSRYINSSLNLNDANPNRLPNQKNIDETITNDPVQIGTANKQEITPNNKKNSNKKPETKEKKSRYITPFPDDLEKEIDVSLLDDKILSVDINTIGTEEE